MPGISLVSLAVAVFPVSCRQDHAYETAELLLTVYLTLSMGARLKVS